MLPAYRSLVTRPGTPALIGAGFLARSAIATYPIGLLSLIAASYGSYAVAGLTVGVYGIAAVVATPLVGRRYDSAGPARVLPIATALQVSMLLAVLGCARTQAPVAVLAAAAGALGLVVPQAGVLIRARWAVLLRGSDDLPKALFLEGAIDELTFVVGPLVIAGLARVIGPAAALLAAGAITAAGGLLLAWQPWTRPEPSRAHPVTAARWRHRGLSSVCLTFAAVGAIFGSIQVGVFATTAETGAAWAAGPVLAVFSAISLVSGLVGGAARAAGPPAHRYRRTVAVLAIGMLLPAAGAPNPVILAVLLAVAAGAASRAVATGYTLAERLVPATRLVEGLGFASAGLSLGLAAGTALAGVVADIAGGRAVFLCGAAIGIAGIFAPRNGSEFLPIKNESGHHDSRRISPCKSELAG